MLMLMHLCLCYAYAYAYAYAYEYAYAYAYALMLMLMLSDGDYRRGNTCGRRTIIHSGGDRALTLTVLQRLLYGGWRDE